MFPIFHCANVLILLRVPLSMPTKKPYEAIWLAVAVAALVLNSFQF
jgi:hypothetical protein